MSGHESDGHHARTRVGQFAAPGSLVTVNGHQVHYLEAGSGSPTVVFEAGMGGNHLDWQEVKARLSPATHAFFYDRAGLGWSEPRPELRTPQQVVRELEALLEAVDVGPPYVLVGHSMGARYVRLFARLHPEKVVGMVAVDGYNEAFDAAIGPDKLRAFIDGRARFYGMVGRLHRLGLVRLLGGRLVSLLGPDFKRMPASERDRYVTVLSQPLAMVAATDELRRGGEANDELAVASLGDLPLVVLTHAIPFPDKEQERAWQASEEDLRSRSTRGSLVVAEGAAHSVMLARPDLVHDAIDRVIAAAAVTA